MLAAALGLVFLVSGTAKLVDRAAWMAQASALGVPVTAAAIVPWLELVVGASVAVQVVEPVPAVVALILLVAFTGVLAWNLRAGRRPPCACFGSWSARPISWLHVARNAAFVALAVAVLAT